MASCYWWRKGYLVVRFRGVRRRPALSERGKILKKTVFLKKENAYYCLLFSSNYP
jgi:hypothetical protein